MAHLLGGAVGRSGETGLRRIGDQRVQGAHVLLLSHARLGKIAGEENATHWELWLWGLGKQDGSFSSGFFKALALPLTIRDDAVFEQVAQQTITVDSLISQSDTVGLCQNVTSGAHL